MNDYLYDLNPMARRMLVGPGMNSGMLEQTNLKRSTYVQIITIAGPPINNVVTKI